MRYVSHGLRTLTTVCLIGKNGVASLRDISLVLGHQGQLLEKVYLTGIHIRSNQTYLLCGYARSGGIYSFPEYILQDPYSYFTTIK
jgi:hypothetical protein